jgi:Rrf2 family iron-sulfur cluster assembly transcriptional regulator
LRRHQLVESVRGPGGGYCLAKDMGQVSVTEIILAVDEPIDATQCGGKENCHDDRKCLTHDLWAALNERIFDYLGGVTLRQLVESQRAKEAERQSGVVQVRDMRDNAKRTTPVSA